MSELKITISLPFRLAEAAQEQIRQGQFSDLNSLVIEALWRYLETHSNERTGHWLRQDVEWGLNGEE